MKVSADETTAQQMYSRRSSRCVPFINVVLCVCVCYLQVPQTIAGKLVAILWALVGISILGMFTATLTTKLQEVMQQLAESSGQQASDLSAFPVANARVGVLNGSLENHLVLQEGGTPVSSPRTYTHRELQFGTDSFERAISGGVQCRAVVRVRAGFPDFFQLLHGLQNGTDALDGIALDHYYYLHYRYVHEKPFARRHEENS